MTTPDKKDSIPVSFMPPTDEEAAVAAKKSQPKKDFAYVSPAGDVSSAKQRQKRTLWYGLMVGGGIIFCALIATVAYFALNPSTGLMEQDSVASDSVSTMGKLQEHLNQLKQDNDNKVNQARDEFKVLATGSHEMVIEQERIQKELEQKEAEAKKAKDDLEKAESDANLQTLSLEKEAELQKTKEEKQKLLDEAAQLKQSFEEERKRLKDDADKKAKDVEVTLKRAQEIHDSLTKYQAKMAATKDIALVSNEVGDALDNLKEINQKNALLLAESRSKLKTRYSPSKILGFTLLGLVGLVAVALGAVFLAVYINNGALQTGFSPLDNFSNEVSKILGQQDIRLDDQIIIGGNTGRTGAIID